MKPAGLTVRGLFARVGGKQVLSGVDLVIKPGEVQALMGANGSGKSSLANVLLGNSDYEVLGGKKKGTAVFEGKNLLLMSADERARAGLFVAWQNPVSIPGVSVFSLCKASYEAQGKKIPKLTEFKEKLEKLTAEVGLTPEHVSRGVNEGFSGGERKRLELFQLLLLSPKLAILDEIDSGLDVDALRVVAQVVKRMRTAGTAFILITHYKRLLEYVKPDRVLIMKAGKIVKSGGEELIHRIEKDGYEKIQG